MHAPERPARRQSLFTDFRARINHGGPQAPAIPEPVAVHRRSTQYIIAKATTRNNRVGKAALKSGGQAFNRPR